jgi:hypothetical protein
MAGWGNRQMAVVDISNPHSPKELGSINLEGYPTAIKVVGKYAYVSGDSDQLFTVNDISDPANPVNLGYSVISGGATSVAVSGNYAYTASWWDGSVNVIDISTPTAPKVVNMIKNINSSYSDNVFISGKYLFVGGDNLTVLDITNPLSPVVLASISNNAGWEGLFVTNGYLYFQDMQDNLLIYNVNALVASGNYHGSL